jgi:hypothetical protein
MNYWPLFMVLSQSRGERQARTAEAMVPALATGPAGLAVAAVMVDQQVRNAETREVNLARETVTAVETVLTKPAGQRQITDAELNAMPRLAAVVNRFPDLRQRIDTTPDVISPLEADVVEVLKIAIKNPKDTPLKQADLQAHPTLRAVLESLPQADRDVILEKKP